MATFSSTLSRHRTQYTLVSLLLLLLLSLFFFFSKRALEPKLSVYRDLFSLPIWSKSTTVPPDDDDVQIQINANNHSSYTNITTSPTTNDDNTNITISPTTNDDNTNITISPTTNDDNHEESQGNDYYTYINMTTTTNTTTTTTTTTAAAARTYGDGDGVNGDAVGLLRNCDLYKGKWVKDEKGHYPIYKQGSCPYVDEAFDCHSNGRPDSEYLKWRWKPDGCDLPRFKPRDFLERLRGKKLMLVGDSMNRNQFESLLCLLREGLSNKSKMYEIHGFKITKGRGYYVFKFEDYNSTVEFTRSHFLVKEGLRINAQGQSNPTLAIDSIDKSARRWKRADILVFNTGHWWAHGKTAKGKNYFKEGDYIYPSFDTVEAYRRALMTWAKWIDENISPDKLVIYRGYSSAHFRGGEWNSGGNCNGETEPVLRGAILDNYPLKMKIVEKVIQEMKLPVVLLNVTRLTNFRKDGHPSIYGKIVTAGRKVSAKRQDCSHWCLPGVPDAWNELLYATLIRQQTSSTTLR